MRSTTHRAATWLEQALIAARGLPESRETLEQAIDVSVDLRNALNELGEGKRAFGFLEEAEQNAHRLGDRRRLARVLVSMNSYLYMSGSAETALVVSQWALATAMDLGDLALQSAILHCLGQDHFARGDFRLAVDHFTRALEYMADERGGRRELLGSTSLLAQHTRSCLAWALAELGECVEAYAIAEDAVRVAEESEHDTSLMAGLLYQGLVRVRAGDPQRAIPLLERALGLLYALNLQGGISFNGVAGSLGDAYVQVGRLPEALPLLERVRTQSLAQGVVSDYFLGAIPLSEAYVLDGRLDEASSIAEEALGLATKHGERGSQARALRALAEVRAGGEPRDLDDAERMFREAVALAETLEMRPLQARCHLGLGKLLHRIGRLDEARAELSTAVRMLRKMEMAHWLPAAEAQLAVASSP
jgi:tetratricopeptide (TPR) repeat protein